MFKASRLKLIANALSLAVGTGVLCGPAFAQNYPQHTIYLFTTEAGGSSDLAARILAQEMTGPLGQPVVVENRPSNVLVEQMATAAPDGYSIMITGNSMWTAPLIRKTGYDAKRDFTPISLLVTQPSVLLVNPASGITSVQQLLSMARAKPGQLHYSAAGIGGSSHLAAELFKSLAGVDITGVFYKGNSEQTVALMNGEVQMNFAVDNTATELVKSGMLTALAVTTADRTPLVPNLPTIAASGVPGYETESMTVMFAPAKTPDAIVGRLNQEVVKVMTSAEVRQKMSALGAQVVASSPEGLADVMNTDIARMGKLVSDAKITVAQ